MSALIERLIAALRPFAACAEHDIGDTEDDADTFRNSTHNRAPKITVGDLRRARAAIAEVGVFRAPCDRCQGLGEIVADWGLYLHPPEGAPGDAGTAPCPDCQGADL